MRVVRTALANMSRMHSNEEEAMTRYALPCGAVQEIEMHKNGRRGRRRSHSVCKREREREREREKAEQERGCELCMMVWRHCRYCRHMRGEAAVAIIRKAVRHQHADDANADAGNAGGVYHGSRTATLALADDLIARGRRKGGQQQHTTTTTHRGEESRPTGTPRDATQTASGAGMLAMPERWCEDRMDALPGSAVQAASESQCEQIAHGGRA